MNIIETVSERLSDAFKVKAMDDSTLSVTTHCLYPSNSLVELCIRHGSDTFVVSDEGRGVREICSAGGNPSSVDKTLRAIVARAGLQIHRGVISATAYGADELPALMVVVANTSRQVAERLFETNRITPEYRVKDVVASFLRNAFADRVREEFIVGNSNKRHKFENVIYLDTGRRITVDAVTRDANSMNARIVANIDVKSAGLKGIDQRIVFDDQDDWSTGDLSLLQTGASLVPLSRMREVLPRIAAA